MKKLLHEKSVKCIFLVVLFLTAAGAWGQVTLPATSPYSENFNTTPGASGTSYPTGWTSYNETTADNAMSVGTATSTTGANYNYGSRIGLLGSGSAFSPSSIVLSITNTTGKSALKISYSVIKIREQNRSNSFNLEISTTSPTSGFTAVTGGTYASGTFAEGTTTAYTNIDISALDNRSSTVYIRWSYTELGGSGSRDGIALDNVSISYATGNPPTVASTVTANAITTNTAASGGNISSDGGATLTEKGVVYALSTVSTTPTISNSKSVASGTATGAFTTSLASLTPNSRYYYRAYATNSGGTGYAPTTLNFWTASLPTVTTTTQSNVGTSTASAGGNVTALGTTGSTAATNTASTVTAKGIVWALSSSADPTITTNLGITDNGSGSGPYTSSMTGLSVNTTYKYRSYATSPEGTAYGTIVTFTTLNIVAPTVTTTAFNAMDDAGVNTASLNGGISANGNAAIVRKGFIWNTTGTNLSIDNINATTVDDTDDTDAAFTTVLSGLDPNTKYYYTAFANNGTATGYGTTYNFYTKAATPGAPGVSNATINSLTVTNDANGNPAATEYVVRVDTPAGIRYVNASGELVTEETWLQSTAVSPIVVTGLAAGTSYTFDVKARNVSGIETPYSSTTALSTVSPTSPYFTLVASDLEFGAICINTTSDAGSVTFTPNNLPLNQQITVNALTGFIYSLTEGGTYTNTLTFDNANTEITFYVKFSPTLVQSYGEPATITITSADTDNLDVHVSGEGVNTPAIAVTGADSDVTVTTATLAGQLTQGCSVITAYGIEYSTTAAFADGTGTAVAGSDLPAGNFSVDVTGLTACTTYYYKAYVTDATGTYYGTQDTFSTQAITDPTTTDATGVAQTSFNATWNAVPGATGYYLDVSTDPNFETIILTEDFSKIIGVEPANDSSKSSPFDLYTQTTGWTGQLLYLTETGNARFGNSGNGGILVTPAQNLSVNSGNITVSFRAKYNGTDAKSIQVQHAPNGSSTYTAVEAAWPLTADFATYSTTITNGSSNSRVRFFPIGAAPSRFHIDDIKIYYGNLLAGYSNLNVNAVTSYQVTGLNPDTKYYYRVRAYGPNCISSNSNTIEAQTSKYLTAGTTDLAFGDVCTNATATGSFTFTGANMTDATLNIATVTGYTYSLSEDGDYTTSLPITGYDGTETTIYVKFDPTAVQAYNGNITIQGAAPYTAATLTLPVTGAGIFTAAIAAAEAATAITMTSASIGATSTAGNCTTNTGYGIEYSTINNFVNGSGTQVAGTGITDGAYTVALTNLLPCKTYYYKAYTTTSGEPVYSAQRTFTTDAIDVVEALDGTDVTGTTFTANWETSDNATGYRIDVSEYEEFGVGNYGSDLIISEYIEGTSNNKAIEIYNGTGAAVNLSQYSIRQQAEGSGTFGSPNSQYTISLPAVTLPAGGVLIAKSAQATLLTIPSGQPANLVISLLYADTGGRTVHFTGNDPIGLFKGETMIDVIGSGSTDYGTNKNIRRKSSVLSPSATYIASQWTTEAISSTNISYLGAHDYEGGMEPSFVEGYENLAVSGGSTASVEIAGLQPFTRYYYRVRAQADDCTTTDSDVIEIRTRGTVTWKNVAGTAKWVPEFYADGTTPLLIDETIDVAIEADYNTDSEEDGLFTPKSITINSGIFTVAEGTTFTVENGIINNAEPENFVVENNGNLIQNRDQNNNSGAITVNRDSSPLYRQDYVMWSSPVAGQDLVAFSPNTSIGRYYQYDPLPGEDEDQANGTYVSASGDFALGKGYIIRMPNAGYNYDTQSYTGTINGSAGQYNNGNATMVFNGKFTGVPNNGDISVTLSNTGNSYHLIGNPYPSPINLPAFFSENENVVRGTVYIWRKKNTTAGISAYVTMNSTGQYADNGEPNTDVDPAGVIRTGQGFIVQMVENPASDQVVFNNGMRSHNTGNQFFRMSPEAASQLPESHGVYLNLTNTAGVYSQMYTGYIEGATDARDNGIDSEYINDKPTVLSTVMAGKEYIIHGRALPFSSQNTEPLQLRVATGGQYKIAIDRTEGAFTTQGIYLQDNMLNIVHNIKASPYTFTTAAGTFTNRFEIVYSPDGTLGTENPVAGDSSIVIFNQDNALKISSMKENISDVTVFDIRGRKLHELINVNAASAQITTLQPEQQVLIVKVKTVNGTVVNKKVIF
ncbi:MAG: T9SS sorting signal type C domain-containing protein [Flavobacterium sp.]